MCTQSHIADFVEQDLSLHIDTVSNMQNSDIAICAICSGEHSSAAAVLTCTEDQSPKTTAVNHRGFAPTSTLHRYRLGDV